MRAFLLFTLCLLLSSFSYGQGTSTENDAGKFTYQGLDWESSKNDVRKEFPDYDLTGNDLAGPTTVGKLDALHYFGFESGSLKVIAFSFLEEHTNKNIYIEDYNYIKKLLIQKYGPPTDEDMNWRDTLFKDDPEDYGLAIARGDLEYNTDWRLSDTNITLTLKGDNYKISHFLLYLPLNKKSSVSTSDEALDKL